MHDEDHRGETTRCWIQWNKFSYKEIASRSQTRCWCTSSHWILYYAESASDSKRGELDQHRGVIAFSFPDAQISASRRIVRPVVSTLNFWYKCCHVTNCRRFSTGRRTVVPSQSIHWDSTSKSSAESLRTTSAIIGPFSALPSRCPETSTHYFFDVVHHQVRVVRARPAGSLEYKRQVFPLHRICSKKNSRGRSRRQWSSRVPPICDQTDSWVTCCVIWFIFTSLTICTNCVNMIHWNIEI